MVIGTCTRYRTWQGRFACAAPSAIALFVLAAIFEIGGAWLIWQGWREHHGLWFIAAGVIAVGAYGFAAAHQPDPNFGRILAAYGGVFSAGSLARSMIVDKFRPTATTSSARVGFQNCVMRVDLPVHAARWYWLMRPVRPCCPIRFCSKSETEAGKVGGAVRRREGGPPGVKAADQVDGDGKS